MCLGSETRRVRNENNLSLKEFGALVGYGKSSISDMERKNKVPSCVVKQAAKKLNAFELEVEKCQECDNNLFTAPYLNTANNNPITILNKLKEELEEAIEATDELLEMQSVKYMLNNPKELEATEVQKEKIVDLLEQIYDVGPGSQFAILIFSKLINFDPERFKQRSEQKLQENGALEK